MSIDGESPSGELSEFETQFVPQPDDDEVLWEVIEIVDERDKRYQVRWAGNDPKTGKPWPLDWIPKHDCTVHLVEEWKRKKAEKRRRSKKTGGRTAAKSRSLTLAKVSTTSSSRKTRTVAEDNVLTDDDEPPRAQSSTSKLQSSKRKRTYIAKESSDSEPAETPESEYPKKKRKLGHRQEFMKQKRKNASRTLASYVHSVESDAVDAATSGGVDGETVVAKCGLPARQRPISKPKEDTLDKSRITTIITPTKHERSSGQGQSTTFSKKKQRDVTTLSLEEANPIHNSKRPPFSRFSDGRTDLEIAADETAAERFEAHSPVASRVSSPALLHLNSSTVPAPPLRHQPRLSPGARARLEIFDSQMGIETDGGGIDDPYVNIGENAHYDAAGDFEPCYLSPNPPLKFPTPPPTATSTAGRNKQPHDSPLSGIVPETESSQSQPSRPKSRANGKNADTPLLKPHSRLTAPSGKLQSVPSIAIMRASSSSRSPSHAGHAASSNDAPARPQKSATRPIPHIAPQTFHKVVEPSTSELDNEPPMSSIESFPSPRKDKGKQRHITDADELQSSSDEESVLGRSDADLRARGEALYEQELKKKELLRITDKPPPKKTLSDVARSRVPLIMTVNGKQSTNGTHPFASSKKNRQGDLAIVQQMEEAYVDLSGGNSTTIDTFTQSGPQDKEAQRIILREEVEENTQEALLGGNPALPEPQVNVAEKPEMQPPEFVIDDVEMCGGNDDVQPSPPMPAERSESDQPSTHIDDLHVASMIVNPSQGQLQERDDEEIIIDLANSPPRSPRNNADATIGRLNHALSALNKKSDEIQALQRELTLERKKSSKLEDELKVRQSANPTTQEARASSTDSAGAMQSHPAVSELADVRAKWNQEREVWEADRRKWEEEIVRLTTERDRLETDAHRLDEVRTSRDADRAAFQLERERWEEERNKLGLLQVTDGLRERKTWSEEGAQLPDQITSLTEAYSTFEAERAAWASERESWVLQQAASTREDASQDVSRELQRAKWLADRAEWASSKEVWEAEREKWSAEHAVMKEAREALTEDVARLNSSLDAMTRSKALAEKDRDFFRDQYSQASGFVSSTRAENAELEQKAAIAEGQARDGVALIKSMFENQIKALKDDVDRWKGVAALLQEKDRRTDDLIRRRAAEQPELAERCRQLEDQVDSLHAELELAHQESFQFSGLRKRKQNLELRSVKLTYSDIKPGEIIEVTSLPDPDSTWTLDGLAADLSAEETVDDEYDLYPCKWKTGASAIDQCQQAFDCREDLDRHMHDYHYRHQLEPRDCLS